MNTGPFVFSFVDGDFNMLIVSVLGGAAPKLNAVDFGLVASSLLCFVSNAKPVPGVVVVAAVALPPKVNNDFEDCYC